MDMLHKSLSLSEVGGLFAVFVVIMVAVWFGYRHLQKKRREMFEQFALRQGFSYAPEGNHFLSDQRPGLFSQGHRRWIQHFLMREEGERREYLFEYRYVKGHGKSRRMIMETVYARRNSGWNLPVFTVDPENFLHRVAGIFGYQDIDFSQDPDFSQAFLLRGEKVTSLREFFHEGRRQVLKQHPKFHLEGGEDLLLVYQRGERRKARDVEFFLQEARTLADAFQRLG